MQVPWPEPPTLWHLVAAAPASERETRQGLRLERRGQGAHSLVAEGTRGQPGATRSPERGHRERVTLAQARARGHLGPGTPPRLRGSTGVPAAGRDELRAQFSETGRRVVPTSRWSSGAGKTEGCRGRAVPLTPRPRLDASLLRAPRSPVTSCCFVTPRGDGL